MTLAERIQLVATLPQAWSSDNTQWESTKWAAQNANAWFTLDYIELAVNNITQSFLQPELLQEWIEKYPAIIQNFDGNKEKTVGIVMAGNLPLVGFHDFLASFLAGFKVKLKLSSKDTVLWDYILQYLTKQDSRFEAIVKSWPMLKNCDAYIATGSNNSARYFEQYFAKYPHIIRKNRTSVAVLTGEESLEELAALSESMHVYFGLGCRNISKIYVPEGYNFEHFIQHTKQYEWQRDHNKYKNNYDFQLAMYILNKVQYMSNESMLFVENKEMSAPVSVVNYSYYKTLNDLKADLNKEDELQCIEVNAKDIANLQQMTTVPVIALGQSQKPLLTDYADNVDTMAFLATL